MAMPRLINVFKRILKEATLDIDKFSSSGKNIHKVDNKAAAPSDYTSSADMDDFLKKSAEKEREERAEKSMTALSFAPRPKSSSAPWYMSPEGAKKSGWKKIANYYVNPKHWKKADPNDYHAIHFDGDDYLLPLTPVAKRFGEIVRQYRIRADTILSDDVWEKYFKKDFGPLEKR